HEDELLASFLDRFGDRLGPDARDLLAAWVRSPDRGLQAHLGGAFDALEEQIQGYQRERDKALRRIKALEEDPTQVGDAPQEIAELKRYRMVLSSLIEDLRRKYPLNVWADASLLPNYAFPESGVHLHSLLGGDERDDRGRRAYEKREYVRPASNALRELAPFNTFYAEGHKVQIRQLELGPKASRVQAWRICPTCHHVARAVDPARPPSEGACPRCGDPGWVDKGQVRSMLPLTVVRSVADRLRSATVDDTEERTRESYHVHQVFEIDPADLEGDAVLLPQLGFGFEALRRVTMTEVNLGLRAALGAAPQVNVAGEAASAEGFATCRDCGGVLDPRGTPRPRDQHAPFCPQREGDTKPRLPLYLFREVTSEAIRFLLPFSAVRVEQQLRSFQAAIGLGLRRRFHGRPIHLQVATMTEPDRTNRTVRRHFLVLFDTVPGGTGYLRDFHRRREVFALLETAHEALVGCSCRARGRDGCYLCLFSHQTQRHLPVLSSRVAERLIDSVLAARHTAEARPGGLSGAPADGVLESELEERFVQALQARFGERMQDLGGDRHEIRAGETTWRLEPQVRLDAEVGEPMRADFVLTATAGPGLGERVVVECDGFAYHVQPGKPGRLADDVRKRTALAARPGWRVVSLTWQDLHDGAEPVRPPAALAAVRPEVWSKVHDKAVSRFPEAFRPLLGTLPALSPLDLLCGLLERPGPVWRDAVGVLACAGLAAAAQAGRLLDAPSQAAATEHLRAAKPMAPMPPLGLRTAPKPADRWARAEVEGHCVALVSARGADIARLDAAGIRVILRLDDEPERRAAADFADSWRRFLHGLNLALLLDEVEVVASSALPEPTSLEDGAQVLLDLGLFAADAPAAPFAAAGIDAILERCLDDEVRDVVRRTQALRHPLPDPDPVELPSGAPAELTWTRQGRKVAVVRLQDLDPSDLQRAAEARWTVLPLPVDDDALNRALGG
ncbi:MAG: DUF1998 domain-containing protein, partial [Myxococcota bacterium]